jgi:tRNA 2-selenouridine synthase
MTYKEINTAELLSIPNIPVIDVRSPSEFKAGHIPDAINMPLFTDQEREQVGITYKQKGKQIATLLGLEIVGPRLRKMVEQANQYAIDNKLILHCWRGGQRSRSVAWLLQTSGLEVFVLANGYKAFRQYIHDYFATKEFRFLVLGGRTGSAKTIILRTMMNLNEQLLDLEGLAHHKGSAFGWIGEQEQETNEQFENNLFHALYNLNPQKIIWVENESRMIGRNYIPETLWQKMKLSPLINIELNIQDRLDHLVSCYDLNDQFALIQSFEKISKRLGHENTKNAIDLIKENKFKEAALIALKYYDKCYDYNLEENISPKIYTIQFENKSVSEIASELIEFKTKHFGE